MPLLTPILECLSLPEPFSGDTPPSREVKCSNQQQGGGVLGLEKGWASPAMRPLWLPDPFPACWRKKPPHHFPPPTSISFFSEARFWGKSGGECVGCLLLGVWGCLLSFFKK